ncbi:MAG TPA: ECF-type sigma factor [Kofleriaceae bacterium]|jgi:RNA polymerase sigma factor (TIGR02999 family)
MIDASMSTGEISELLAKVGEGDAASKDVLLELVYRDLEAMARAVMRRSDGSLEPSGLVHELYMRFANTPLAARDRRHFFAIAARAMRQIVTDRARRKQTAKRGRDLERVTLSDVGVRNDGVELLAVDAALTRLETLSPRQARIVELRCLVGLTVEETAEVLDVSERTVHAEWRLARAWLARELGAHDSR